MTHDTDRETARRMIDAGLYAAAVELMDDEIREAIHADLAPCTDEDFLTEYLRRHRAKYAQDFTV